MKKSIKLLLVAAALFGLGTASAVANPLESKNFLGIGVLGGDVNAVGGIQYQRWLNDRFALTFDGYINYSSKPDTYYVADFHPFDVNFNTEIDVRMFQGNFGKSSAVRLSAYEKTGFIGYTEKGSVETETPPYSKELYKFKSDAYIGMGFIVDLMLFEHISIPVQFGYSLSFPNNFDAGFCIGTGIRYIF